LGVKVGSFFFFVQQVLLKNQLQHDKLIDFKKRGHYEYILQGEPGWSA
jgi:hypothetical protein